MDWCAADGETVHVVPASATRVHTEKVRPRDRLVHGIVSKILDRGQGSHRDFVFLGWSIVIASSYMSDILERKRPNAGISLDDVQLCAWSPIKL
jgi:hypothetical protein